MIGRHDKKHSYPIRGKSKPITFNLYEEIHLVNSVDYPGIQLADVISAAFAYAVTNGQPDRYSQQWREYASSMIEDRFVMPDMDMIDLDQYKVQRNAIILEELVERSVNRRSLVDDMPEYVRRVSKSLLLHPLQIPRV